MEKTRIECFKAYDVRGKVPDELNADVARRIGRGFAAFLQPRHVVVGYDIRLTGPGMAEAIAEGLCASGVDVYTIGLCGTEEVYFAVSHFGMDGGIMVTASHNPADYNGMKLVREQSRPLSADTGLEEIRHLAEEGEFRDASRPGKRYELDHRADYDQTLLDAIDPTALAGLDIVANAGNGGAGSVMDRLLPHLPFNAQRIHFGPDGHFPNGVPNPMLEENRAVTTDAVQRTGADMGIAWDGDFDRCFFFDERGEFIEGYYVLGMLATSMLEKHPGGTVIYDPRLTWNTLDIVNAAGGRAVQSKAGHAFIKEVMRREDAIYGGEMSAHHYFRDFAYCDSGMLPWLLVAELLSRDSRTLSERVAERQRRYPVSGEINRGVDDVSAAMGVIESRFAREARSVEHLDGLSAEFDQWRFNLRPSNTEPVVRLNVESRGDSVLMEDKTDALLKALDTLAG